MQGDSGGRRNIPRRLLHQLELHVASECQRVAWIYTQLLETLACSTGIPVLLHLSNLFSEQIDAYRRLEIGSVGSHVLVEFSAHFFE